MRKAVFFDLDGTLLPMDMAQFSRLYYAAVDDHGVMEHIHPTNGHEIFGKGIYAMLGNNGKASNADVFFGTIGRYSPVSRTSFETVMDEFYRGSYPRMKDSTQPEPLVPEIVATLKAKGYRLILSTQPVFPPVATNQRVQWAGLSPDDFEYISYYVNSGWCKPSPDYFREILRNTGLHAEECYIVGNDVREDMGAVALGFEGFLVTSQLIGKLEDAPECKKGDYSALAEFVKGLPEI